MSKDKHKGVARRKFALANLPRVDWGKKKVISGYPRHGTDKWKGNPSVDITEDLRQLEKEGKIKRSRTPAFSIFGRHIKRTLLEKADDRSHSNKKR